MSAFGETAVPYRPLVVFDFDHTLYDGDSGSHLVAWLIRRHSPIAPATASLAPTVGTLPSDGNCPPAWTADCWALS